MFDRAYTDYNWFANLTRRQVYFVNRMKENADYMVLEDRPPDTAEGVPAGSSHRSVISRPKPKTRTSCGALSIHDEEQQRTLVFLTKLIALLLIKYPKLKPSSVGRYRIWWLCCDSNSLCTAIYGLGWTNHFNALPPLDPFTFCVAQFAALNAQHASGKDNGKLQKHSGPTTPYK